MVQQVHTTKGGNMRRMKKAIAMGLATMMTISLAACGNTSGETTQETERCSYDRKYREWRKPDILLVGKPDQK